MEAQANRVHKYDVCLICMHFRGTPRLPVHGDLPVQLTGERNPADGLVVVLRISATEDYHTAFKVSVQESRKEFINPLRTDQAL